MASSSAPPTNSPAALFTLLPTLPSELRELIWRTQFPRFHITIDVELNEMLSSDDDGPTTGPREGDRRPADIEIKIDHGRINWGIDNYQNLNYIVKNTVKQPPGGIAIVKHYTFRNFDETSGPVTQPARFSVDTSSGVAIGTLPYIKGTKTDMKNALGAMNDDLEGGLGSIKELRLFERCWNGKPWRLDLADSLSYSIGLGDLLAPFTGLTRLLFLVPNGLMDERMYREELLSEHQWEAPISHGWKVCQQAARDHFDKIELATGAVAPEVHILQIPHLCESDIVQQTEDVSYDSGYEWIRSDGRYRGGDWNEYNREIDPTRSTYPNHIEQYFQTNPLTRVFGQNN